MGDNVNPTEVVEVLVLNVDIDAVLTVVLLMSPLIPGLSTMKVFSHS
jgi:hypothetical protein